MLLKKACSCGCKNKNPFLMSRHRVQNWPLEQLERSCIIQFFDSRASSEVSKESDCESDSLKIRYHMTSVRHLLGYRRGVVLAIALKSKESPQKISLSGHAWLHRISILLNQSFMKRRKPFSSTRELILLWQQASLTTHFQEIWGKSWVGEITLLSRATQTKKAWLWLGCLLSEVFGLTSGKCQTILNDYQQDLQSSWRHLQRWRMSLQIENWGWSFFCQNLLLNPIFNYLQRNNQILRLFG